jgi:PKD repeat protein
MKKIGATLILLVGMTFSTGVFAQGADNPTSPANPEAGTWTMTGFMNTARYGHTATLLQNGKVLIVGGYDSSGNALSSAELYDPNTGQFQMAGNLNYPRVMHTATLLPTGKVLIAGGDYPSGNTAEIYNPTTGSFSVSSLMQIHRQKHTATLLPNGKVVIIGGYNYEMSCSIFDSEIYDPSADSFTLAGSLNNARDGHISALLNNGKVLVYGGWCFCMGTCSLSKIELYDPITNLYTISDNSSGTPLDRSGVKLDNGDMLFTGGSYFDLPGVSFAEIYLASANSVRQISNLLLGRVSHTSTLMNNGQVLIIGGYPGWNPSTSSVEIYNPISMTFLIGSSMNVPRAQHTATKLANGKILVAGGDNTYNNTPVSSAELYDPGSSCSTNYSNIFFDDFDYYDTADMLRFNGGTAPVWRVSVPSSGYVQFPKEGPHQSSIRIGLSSSQAVGPASGSGVNTMIRFRYGTYATLVRFTGLSSANASDECVQSFYTMGQWDDTSSYYSECDYEFYSHVPQNSGQNYLNCVTYDSYVPKINKAKPLSGIGTGEWYGLLMQAKEGAAPLLYVYRYNNGTWDYVGEFTDAPANYGPTSDMSIDLINWWNELGANQSYSNDFDTDWVYYAKDKYLTMDQVSADVENFKTCGKKNYDDVGYYLVPPTKLTGSRQSTNANMSWTYSGNPGPQFLIERRVANVDYGWEVIGATTDKSFSDTGLTSNISYDYRVRAKDSHGASAFSNAITLAGVSGASVNLAYSAPASGGLNPPQNLQATSGNFLAADYGAFAPALLGYDFYRATIDSDSYYSKINSSLVPASQLSYIDYTPGQGLQYYRAKAVYDSGTSGWSNTANVSVGNDCSLTCSATATKNSNYTYAFLVSTITNNCSGTPTYSWNFGDVYTSAEQNPTHTYSVPGTYNWSLTVSVDGATCSKTGTITISNQNSPVISSVSKASSPFRLIILGTMFVSGCYVSVDGVAAPSTLYKSTTKLVAKGGNSLKVMIPKGVPVQITVVNPDGSVSNGFVYTR